METTLERLEGSRVRVTLNFGVDEMAVAFDKAYRTLGKQVTVPGFRPGKAPRALLERRLGKEVAPAQVMQDLVPDALEKAIEEQSLQTIGDPELEPEPPVAGEPYEVIAVFHVWPEPVIGEWSGEKVVRPKLVLSDEATDGAVRALQLANATSVDVTDRPLAIGDFARIRYQVTCDDEALYPEEQLPEMYLQVGEEWYLPALDNDLVGLSIGETKDIATVYGDDHQVPRLAGRPATFRVTLESIQSREVPELDEAFFTKVGVSDLEALKAKVATERAESISGDLSRATRDQALLAVVRHTTVDYPAAAIEAQVTERERAMLRTLDEEGLTFEDYLADSGLTTDEYALLQIGRSRRAIATALVVEKLAKDHGIEVPEEELEEAVWRLAQTAKMGFSEMNDLLERTGQLEEMKNQRLADRVADWILGQLTVEEPEMDYDELVAGDWVPDLDAEDIAAGRPLPEADDEGPDEENADEETLEVETSDEETLDVDTSEEDTPEEETPEVCTPEEEPAAEAEAPPAEETGTEEA